MTNCIRLAWLGVLVSTVGCAHRVPLWKDGKPECRIVVRNAENRAQRLGQSTINYYLREFYDVELPVASETVRPGTYIMLGTPETRKEIAGLVGDKLAAAADIGDEGFELLTHNDGKSNYVIVYGNTPRAVKHGCQELVFFRTAATRSGGFVDWPLKMTMKPEFAYRGTYMLPCWSAHDSVESWQRVLRFNSELTLNRNWFWLDGFPVAGHTGEYAGTDLADDGNVQRLIDLTNSEDMKFYVGGGWFTWHHAKAVGKDLARGRDYYLEYLKAFKGIRGFYIEPTGEGGETGNWKAEAVALRELIDTTLNQEKDFEFAIAIGKFNNPEYHRIMARCDPKRVFWWWCWGDPIQLKALDLYPSVLRWHVITRMSDFHGSMEAPLPSERRLTGYATSYDPGQGFGNPWNGWGKLGVDKPRNVHPHTVPHFGHQYLFRERCWNVDLSETDFVARLHRRLFDADAPANAGALYWRLTQMTLKVNLGAKADATALAPIQAFLVTTRGRTWTPRMTDTLARMEEAVEHLAELAAKPPQPATSPAK